MDKKYSNFQFIKDFFYFVRNHKTKFIFFSIILTIGILIGLIPPLILAEIINFFVDNTKELSHFYLLLIGFFASTMIGYSLISFSKYKLEILSNKMQNELKVSSFEKIVSGNLAWQDKEKTGNKLEKINSGEKDFQKLMGLYIHKGMGNIITTLGVLGVFAFFGLKYLILTIVFLFTYLYFENKFNKKMSAISLELKKVKEESSGSSFEISSTISTIKSLGLESHSQKKIFGLEDNILKLKNERRMASTKKWYVVTFIQSLFFALFLFLVGSDIAKGILAIGIFVVYIDYFKKLHNFLGMVSLESNKVIDVKSSFNRMMGLLRSIPEIKEEGAHNLGSWKKIIFKNVSFGYNKNEKILKDFNLEIKKGEKIGIVGFSGSGKSTFFKLLLKLYLPSKGKILIDDKEIQEVKRDSLLHKISYVPQDVELFNLSIKDNVKISSKVNSLKKYKNSLSTSLTNEVISKLPKKDLTVLGEKGTRISGGEKQRIGIARALYKDSEILILDEATSNLDFNTERKIQNNLNELKNKTLIVSAHRLSTLQNMDKIIYLEKGAIIEQGSFKELIKNKGKFYKLWQKNKTKKE
jgi:ATP-binding cassette subfamily B protein|tara:strand:- start:74 stop:1816 length:1743 start_codon:yes stop_codon:yes gene_type:complete